MSENIKLGDLVKDVIQEGKSILPELEQVAKKHLGIKTLKTQNRDSEDFHDLAVWKIKSALKAAYNLGKNSEKK